ncbi:MAG: nucleotidyl transferase AbiEii/AbiGii toxin family protein [Treponema sp.]|jgi:hypothetical protein|nr:nucleotidyl transferase AbiEii/AbiGii toxin family protein [Treponema sp.]
MYCIYSRAESPEALLADKVIAFALRPGRVKNRDLWDIHWISQKSINLSGDLLTQKLADRETRPEKFIRLYETRLEAIKNGQEDFLFEMRRFLSRRAFDETFTSPLWWDYLLSLLKRLARGLP